MEECGNKIIYIQCTETKFKFLVKVNYNYEDLSREEINNLFDDPYDAIHAGLIGERWNLIYECSNEENLFDVMCKVSGMSHLRNIYGFPSDRTSVDFRLLNGFRISS